MQFEFIIAQTLQLEDSSSVQKWSWTCRERFSGSAVQLSFRVEWSARGWWWAPLGLQNGPNTQLKGAFVPSGVFIHVQEPSRLLILWGTNECIDSSKRCQTSTFEKLRNCTKCWHGEEEKGAGLLTWTFCNHFTAVLSFEFKCFAFSLWKNKPSHNKESRVTEMCVGFLIFLKYEAHPWSLFPERVRKC